MMEREITDLHFSRSRDPIPTVEVDLDSIPKTLSGYGDTVAALLDPIAAEFPGLRATIYVYQGGSVNFHMPSWSAFFGIDGPSSLLQEIHRGFERIPGVRVRFSDYIHPSQGLCEFHVEDGKVWRPVDAATWYTNDVQAQDAPEADWPDEPEEQPVATDDDEWEEGRVATRAETPSRFRAARGDASVGSIRRKIEQVFGLPEGSVALCGPDGQALRADARIATLRKRWS